MLYLLIYLTIGNSAAFPIIRKKTVKIQILISNLYSGSLPNVIWTHLLYEIFVSVPIIAYFQRVVQHFKSSH